MLITVKATDNGGWTAIASTGSKDRDGEVIVPGAFAPLPPDIPVHVDHTFGVKTLIGRARPYYVGDQLHVDGVFASNADAQEVRQKVADGVLTQMSVGFLTTQDDVREGVRHITQADLLEVSFVSIPSQRDSRVLSVRSVQATDTKAVRRELNRALLMLAQVSLDEAKRYDRTPARDTVARSLRGL